MEIRLFQGVTILDLTDGWLDDPELRLAKQIEQLATSGRKKILVNLTNVSDKFGDHGMGNLVRAYLICKKADAELKLVNPRIDFHEVLEHTHMAPFLPAYSDELEALSNFR